VLDDIEHLFLEGLHQLLGVDRADALDHAGGEVLLYALGGGRRRRAQEIGTKLHPVRPIVDPSAARLHELARANGRSVADDGDQIALAARLDTQHAEAAVLVVEGDALDEAGEVLAVGCGLRHSHPRLTSSPLRSPGARSSIGAQRLQEPC
jgi:hypothetical protein